MPLYNTLVQVVALVDTTDAQAAIDELIRQVQAAGFEVYEGQNPGPDAFLSEPLDEQS